VAAAEVATPVASGMAIIALVFLPLLTLQGLEGKLFAPVALTIVLALLSALALALTLIPVLSFFLLKVGGGSHDAHHEPWLMRQLNPRYARLLAGAFARKRLVFGVAGFRWPSPGWPIRSRARPSCQRWMKAASSCS
jgi:cobalt-zinc-cadmium resistance protein CzcA